MQCQNALLLSLRMETVMIVKEFKCQRCGNLFVVEMIDRKDPDERQIVGAPVHWSNQLLAVCES